MCKTHPKQKGDIAVSKVVYELSKIGITPLQPVGENTRYDIVGDNGRKFIKIQVKHMYKRKNVWILKARSTRVNTKANISKGYTDREIDFLIGYKPDTEDCYVIPISDINGRGDLVINETNRHRNQFEPVKYINFKNAWHLLK